MCYNQLQKYLRHCTIFWHKWPVHDLVLVTPLHPLSKLLAIQDHTPNLEEQLWMGGRREVSIISHRPVTRSNLKQERLFFRGSVSTFLQLAVALLTARILKFFIERLSVERLFEYLPPSHPLCFLLLQFHQRDRCLEWGLMSGLQGFASHGGSILSRGWLATVGTHGIPGTHLPLKLGRSGVNQVYAKFSRYISFWICTQLTLLALVHSFYQFSYGAFKFLLFLFVMQQGDSFIQYLEVSETATSFITPGNYFCHMSYDT